MLFAEEHEWPLSPFSHCRRARKKSGGGLRAVVMVSVLRASPVGCGKPTHESTHHHWSTKMSGTDSKSWADSWRINKYFDTVQQRPTCQQPNRYSTQLASRCSLLYIYEPARVTPQNTLPPSPFHKTQTDIQINSPLHFREHKHGPIFYWWLHKFVELFNLKPRISRATKWLQPAISKFPSTSFRPWFSTTTI